jgi:hypothetical protein
VTLRFYRDASRSQTPVSTPQHPIIPAFPSEQNKKSSFFTEKTQKFANFFNQVSILNKTFILRQMLSDKNKLPRLPSSQLSNIHGKDQGPVS